jgi:hypothetical protein
VSRGSVSQCVLTDDFALSQMRAMSWVGGPGDIAAWIPSAERPRPSGFQDPPVNSLTCTNTAAADDLGTYSA